MQGKRIYNGCLNSNSITRDNCSANLVMPNSYASDRIFNQELTTINNSSSLTSDSVFNVGPDQM